jgi:hypothetical protein
MAGNKDQDVELNDIDDVEEAHDPKNAEKQSNAAIIASAGKTKQAPTRGSADKHNAETMPKSKAGMISAAHDLMSEMKVEDLAALLDALTNEESPDTFAESRVQINTDFTADLDALVASEATLSEEFKTKTAAIFEAAVKSKLSVEIDALEEAYAAELHEEVESIRTDLVEKVNNYLNYVVESWMEDNELAIQTGLRTEIAEGFMTRLKDLFEESYIEVPESKVDLFDELAEANEELTTQLNNSIAKSMRMAEQLETFKRDATIREAASGLADTQVEKLKSLTDNISFDDEASFAAKVATIRESYFTKIKKTTADLISLDEDTDSNVQTQDISSTMARYVNALRKTS